MTSIAELDAALTTSARHRALLMNRRQAIIIELGGIEDYLRMPRSIVPRRKRTPEAMLERFDELTEHLRDDVD